MTGIIPGDLGVPQGATFRIHANVMAGTDRVSSERFVYSFYSSDSARLRIRGTTLINHLVFEGVFPPGEQQSDKV